MSISINPSQTNYDYQKNLSESQAKASNNQNTYAQIFKDLLKLESQNTSNTSLSNGNLGSLLMGSSNLNQTSSTLPDDLQTFLTGLLGNGSADDSSDSASSQDSLDLSSLASEGTGGQLQSLLSLLPDLIGSSQITADDQSSESDTGFPPILQSSGATLPPFNWKPSTTQKA